MTTENGAQGAGGQGGQNGAGAGGSGGHWASGFQDAGLRDLAMKRGWTGPEQVVQSYRDYEAMRGAPKERLLVLPDKEDAAEWGEVWSKLGRPGKPEEYGIEGLTPELAALLHKENLTTRQAKNLAAALAQMQTTQTEAADLASAQELQLEQDQLRKEWGGEYDTLNRHAREVVSRAAKAAGITDMEKVGDIIEAMEGAFKGKLGKGGYVNTMKFFAYLGKNLGEGRFVENQGGSGQGGGFGSTPDAAMAEFRQLSADPAFMKLVESGDSVANAKFERLAKLASPRFSAGGPQS